MRKKNGTMSLQTIVFTVFILFLLIPSVFIIMNYSKNKFEHLENDIKIELNISSYNHKKFLENWLETKKYLLTQTAKKISATSGFSKFQNDLETLKERNKDFHNIYIADSTATTLAFYPILNENGNSNIGLNFSDRQYYKKLIETKKPVISDVFMGRGGIFKPIITISAPLMNNNNFNGYITGAINLDEIRKMFISFSDKFNIEIIVIDNNGNIVTTTDTAYKELEKFNNFDNFEKVIYSKNFFRILPYISSNMPALQKWSKSKYIIKSEIENGWTIYSMIKSEPYQLKLYKFNTNNLFLIFILLFAAILLSNFISKNLFRSINQLNSITEDIPNKLNNNAPIQWVSSRFEEFENLNERFKKMTEKLKEYIIALKKHQDSLETRITERTAELENAYTNLKLETAEKQKIIHALQLREKAIQSSSEGIIITDAFNDNAIIFFNNGFEKSTGYSAEEILGKNPRFLRGKNSSDSIRNQIKEAIKSGVPISIEIINYKKNGDSFWNLVSISPIKNEAGIITNYVGIHQDISLIKENQLRINAILTTATNAIITINSRGIIELFNPAAEKIFGYSANEIIGKNVKILMPDEIARKHDTYLQNYLQTGIKNIIGIIHELKAKRKNGEIFPIEISVSEIKINQKIIFSAIIQDISTRKEFEKKLKEAKIIAETANQTKSAFLASVSHEIRTPMNAIISMSHFLKKTGLNKEQTEYNNVLKNSSESLMFLIEDILDISKLDNVMMKLENIPFNINDVISKTISIVELKIKEKGLRFDYSIDANIPEILIGDSLRLKQVMLNILSNAVKFTEIGSINLNLVMNYKSDYTCEILFSVTDTGIGIPDSKKNIAFEKFMQVDTSTTRKYGGTGLGLFICKEILNLMGGKIWVEDNISQGSIFKFTVTFGISNKSEKILEAIESDNIKESIKNDAACKILVAEDDKTNQFIIKNLFKDFANITVIFANNGIEAVELFKSNKFDFILMDVNMPEMDGITAIQKIREYEKNSNTDSITPIMIFTATTIEQLTDKIKDLNISGYILKPIAPAKFYKQIAPLLNSTSILNSNKLAKNETVNEEVLQHNILNKLIKLGGETIDIKKALNNIDDEFELYKTILEQFMQDYGSKIDEIKLNFESKNNDKIIFTAHKLYTASANIGAYKLSALSKQIENLLTEKKEVEENLFNNYITELLRVNIFCVDCLKLFEASKIY